MANHGGHFTSPWPPTNSVMEEHMSSALDSGDPWMAQRFSTYLRPRAWSWSPGIESYIGGSCREPASPSACVSSCVCVCVCVYVCLMNCELKFKKKRKEKRNKQTWNTFTNTPRYRQVSWIRQKRNTAKRFKSQFLITIALQKNRIWYFQIFTQKCHFTAQW